MSTSPEVGSTANSYEILAKLAVGGMAEIFLARGASAAGVSRYVVLKRILRERATDVEFVRMFLDEARLAAQLQHPNIAQVHDIGRLGDSYFFTMEYVHGETVRALLGRSHALRRPVPLNCVATVIAGAAQGLHHAHLRNGMDGRPLGIVHRDVSPSNLMVSYEGNVKLVDFGVAKATERSAETRSGTVKGKISYLSPEQCRGAAVDRRSDLFALGIVLWEMLTTERLFKRGSDFENMNAIVHDDVPPPSTKRADVPPELDALVRKALAKRPEDRFQSGEELVEALEVVAARCGFVLSTAALGRYVRELFGQKREPWIEQNGHAPAEGVTVTSAPIPDELLAPVASMVDQALAHVADLSAHAAGSHDDDSPPGGAPLPKVTGPTVAMPTPPGLRSPTRNTARGVMPALVLPAPGGDPAPLGLGASGSIAAAPTPRRSRAPVFVWIVVPALVLGVALGAILYGRGRAEGGARVDAGAPAVASPVVMPVARPDASPPDGALVIAPEDAAVAEAIDAAVTIDAGSPRAPHPAHVAPPPHVVAAPALPPATPAVDAGVDCAADPLACQH